MQGILYIVATPIGNLEDITLRALRILKEVDFIAAEDTRHTLKLLNHYEIKTPLISCHEHNERSKGQQIAVRLLAGESAALVTDAGMPSVSDPGYWTVSACKNAGIAVTACPGASAAITALALSGIPSERYCFEGFLSSKKKDRRNAAEELSKETRTIIVYESPHRLLECLRDFREALGNRLVSVARELTKIHEEVITDTFDNVIAHFCQNEPRGEFVLVIQGADKGLIKQEKAVAWQSMSIESHVNMYMAEGLSEADSIKRAAKDRGLPKREVYAAVKINIGRQI